MKPINLPADFISRPATLEDIPELVKLFNRVSMDMLGVENFTINELEVDFQTPGFDLATSSQAVLNEAGEIIAYGDVFPWRQPPVYPDVFARVHPDYMNRGLGTAILQWCEERAKLFLPELPADARVALRTGTPSTWQPSKQLFADLGWQHYRSYFSMRIDMDAPPPQPVWPEGLKVVTYQHPTQAEAVYRAVDDAFMDHFGHISEPFEIGFDRFTKRNFQDEGFDPNLWFLVMDGDEIAAICLNRKWDWESKDYGHVNTLGVRRKWRKRGLGLALLQYTFNTYWERGQKTVTLGVDASSLTGAVRLYEKAGMYVYRRHDGYERLIRDGRDLSTTEVEN